jgi:hypothetical protein
VAIYTPRGLKVRVSVPYAFGLLARLHPRVSAFRVLKTTEGLELLPGLLAFLAGVILFLQRQNPTLVATAVFVAYLVGLIINSVHLHSIPGLVPLSTAWSHIAGFGLPYVVAVIIGYVCVGWRGSVAFLLGSLLGWIAMHILDFLSAKKSYRELGQALTMSERNFFSAYQIHASRIGVSTDLDLAEAELSEENWAPAFQRLAEERPALVAMYT